MGRMSFGDFTLDTQKSRLYHRGKPLELEPQIYGILELLIIRHGEIVSRDEIIEAVWAGRLVSNNVIGNRIKSVRAAIGDSGKSQLWIKTYPSLGYKFIGEVRAANEDVKPSKATISNSEFAANNSQEVLSRKGMSSLKNSTFLKLAAMSVVGAFGFFVFSQFTRSEIAQTAPVVETGNEAEVYRLASSDEADTLPRLAILPFETIGNSSDYGLMPEILKGQFEESITAIEGLTLVSFFKWTGPNGKVENYKKLQEQFDLDYAIASKISPDGEDFKLHTFLIRLNDNSTIFSETFDLKSSTEGGLTDSLEDIAIKVTLMTANNLDLSMVDLPSSWKNYDFNLKIEQAISIYDNGDYQSFKKAAQLFREAIEEEPNYLPAYSWLLSSLGWMGVYVVEGDKALAKEQAELALKMKEISPQAPETLLINSFMGSLVDGVKKESLGEFDETDPQSVINYILKKDPDNLQASLMVADMSAFVKEQSETVEAYENVLRLAPTHPWYLMEYSRALFCNGDINRANQVIKTSSKWHPDSRFSLLAQLRKSHALGEYEEALITLKRIMEQGILAHEDTVSARNLFFDLGHPELALPHVRFPPARAHAHAMMGNKEAALEAAAIIRSFHTSVRSRMIVDEDYFPDDYSPYRTYARVGHPDGVTKANACRLDFLARDTYVLKKVRSEKFDRLLPLLTDYFEGKDPISLNTQQEYLGLIGLHVILSDFDKAIEVMDIAIDKGFLFIGSFKEPHLRELTAYPGFAERLERMQKKADLLIEKYYFD